MPFAAAQPAPHDDPHAVTDAAPPRRVTLLELFFDLVYVVALVLISEDLYGTISRQDPDHPLTPAENWHEAGHALILLMALWWVWVLTTTVVNLYDPQNRQVKRLIPVVMAGALLMATAVPHAFDSQGLVFAGTYVTIHLVRGAVLIWTARHDAPERRRAARVTIWFTVSAVFWITGAFLPDGAREACWLPALTIDYLGLRFAYRVLGLGAVPTTQRTVAAEHLSERYQQFFTIALGDCILVIGTLLGADQSDEENLIAFGVAFLTTVLLWRIYVHRSGALLPVAIRKATTPSRFLHTAPYTHLLMVMGVVVTAAGFNLVLHDPSGRTPLSWVVITLGGPALFLVGRALFEYQVFSRVSYSRPGGLLVLLALAPWALFLPPLITSTGAMLVLAGVAAADTRRSWRRPVEHPVPPR